MIIKSKKKKSITIRILLCIRIILGLMSRILKYFYLLKTVRCCTQYLILFSQKIIKEVQYLFYVTYKKIFLKTFLFNILYPRHKQVWILIDISNEKMIAIK